VKISVIIPALNEAENIEPCLLSVARQQGQFEIIVVDGQSTDGTAEIAERYATVIISERGRAVQMNEGARRAQGDVLLFLHADSILHPYALTRLQEALEDSHVVGGTFTLRFDSDKFLLKFIAFFTRFKIRYFHYGDQGVFVRRSVFERLGGFKEMPLMEDIDFLLRLRKSGRVSLIRSPVTTSARRFLERGIVRQQMLNNFLVALYVLGVKPQTLSKLYRTNRLATQEAAAKSADAQRQKGAN
jgi:rSAM/selenodomain-associated transferase 2